METNIKFIDQIENSDRFGLSKMILFKNHVLLTDDDVGKSIIDILKFKYSIVLHLSEKKSYLSLVSFPMNKFLSKKILHQIDSL